MVPSLYLCGLLAMSPQNGSLIRILFSNKPQFTWEFNSNNKFNCHIENNKKINLSRTKFEPKRIAKTR